MQETQVGSLAREDPLEKGMATHFSILAWRIPRTEEPGALQSMASHRVGHDWATNIFMFISHSWKHDNNAVWNFTAFYLKKNLSNKWKMSILKYPEVYSVFQKDVSHLPFGTPGRISKFSASKISVSVPDTTEVSLSLPNKPAGQQHLTRLQKYVSQETLLERSLQRMSMQHLRWLWTHRWGTELTQHSPWTLWQESCPP